MNQLSNTNTLAVLDTTNSVFCNEEIAIRVIRSWEARNFKKGQLLMGQELLLLDSESTAVQAFIPAIRLPRFLHLIHVGKTYKIRRIMLKPARDRFKVADNKHVVIFTDHTTIAELPECGISIPKQRFRLRVMEEFAAIADKDVDLFDILGEIVLINGVAGSFDTGSSKECVSVHLRLKDGETMRAYLWSTVAGQVRQRWEEPASKPTIILLTTVNSRTLGGIVCVKSTASTRVFFDTDITETKNHLQWVQKGCPGMPTITASTSAVTKVETASIDEVHQFLQTADPETFKKAGFYVYGTIVGVPESQKWNYIGCSTCSTQLGKTDTSLYCNKCQKTNNIGLTRYRFEVTVRDKAGEMATFVIFDTEGTKILGKTATDILQAEGDEATNGRAPAALKTIIGSSWKFQIQVTNYNLTAIRQTFTVKTMTEEIKTIGAEGNDGADNEILESESKTATKKPRIDH